MGRHNFKNLKIWQNGMDLVDETYKLIAGFPKDERFNLSAQLSRCAVSIPSNIAEGTSKSSYKHFNKYLENSLGSAFEWETQLIIAYRQRFIPKGKYELLEDKIQQLQKMISGFQGGLNS